MDAFFGFAGSLADLSTCRRLRVGCLMVTPGFTEVLSVGYNGPPSGEDNDSCRGEEGSCGCIHAEANALVKLRDHREGLVMLSTVSPCEHCAGLVLNSRQVTAVVYGEEYRDKIGLGLLTRRGVLTARWKKKTPEG